MQLTSYATPQSNLGLTEQKNVFFSSSSSNLPPRNNKNNFFVIYEIFLFVNLFSSLYTFAPHQNDFHGRKLAIETLAERFFSALLATNQNNQLNIEMIILLRVQDIMLE